MGQLTLSHDGVGKVHEDDLARPTSEIAPQQFEVGWTTGLQSLARVQVLAVAAMVPLESKQETPQLEDAPPVAPVPPFPPVAVLPPLAVLPPWAMVPP